MMTSHLCAASVLRTKPVACGYQLYESPLPSLSASNSASLFSKPSPRSVENGMLCGSAQTLSTLGSMSSSDKSGRSTACASSFPDRNTAATAVHEAYKLNRSHLPLTEFVILTEPLRRRSAPSSCLAPGSAQPLYPRQLFSAWVAASGLSSCFCGLPRGTASLARARR